MRKSLITILKVAFAVGIIAYMVKANAIDFKALAGIFTIGFIVQCIMISFINLVLGAERWRALLKAQDIHLSFFSAVRLTLTGLFFNFVVPGGVGGDVVKGYYIVRDNPTRKIQAAMSVLMDRILGLYSMIFLALICLLFNSGVKVEDPKLILLERTVLIVFIVFSIGLAVALSSRIRAIGVEKILARLPMGARLVQVYDAAHSYGSKGKTILYALFLSAVAQFFAVFMFVLVGNAMGLDVPWSVYFFVVPIGFMATAIPVSPAGVGVGQVAFYFLFNLVLGRETALGSNGITVAQIMQLIFGVVGAFFFIRNKKVMPELQS